eukprot:60840-Pyramimonas_sp.AAC.1
MEGEAAEEGQEEVPATPAPEPPATVIHPDRVTIEGVEARYNRTLFGVPLLVDADIANLGWELRQNTRSQYGV